MNVSLRGSNHPQNKNVQYRVSPEFNRLEVFTERESVQHSSSIEVNDFSQSEEELENERVAVKKKYSVSLFFT